MSMTDPHRVGALEITEDIPAQEREWKVQRLAWTLMLILIVLALLGVFSTGPLSSAEHASDDGTLAIEYQRFVRHDGRTTVVIEASGSRAESGEVEVWVSNAYLHGVDLQGISPEPDQIRDAGDRRIMVFLVDDPATTLTVSFSIRPRDMGRLSGKVGVVDGPSVSFSQISYP
jgi:hypothetical protein